MLQVETETVHAVLGSPITIGLLALALAYYAFNNVFLPAKYFTYSRVLKGPFLKLPPNSSDIPTGSLLKPMIDQNYSHLKKSFFTIEQRYSPIIIVPAKYLSELRNLPEDQVSFEGINHDRFIPDISLQGGRAFGGDEDTLVKSVRNQLTRNLGSVMADIHDETRLAFETYLNDCEDWKSVDIATVLLDIVAMVSGRVFGGTEVSRSPEYLRASVQFTRETNNAATEALNTPKFFHPFMKYYSQSVRKVYESLYAVEKVMKPIIEKRAEAFAKGETLPNNMITWFMQNSAPQNRNNVRIQAHGQLLAGFVAIHTTSISTTHILYDIAARTEYIQPLRDELKRIREEEKVDYLTKNAMPKLRLLDSIMKESTRMNSLDIFSFLRKVHKDITLSDGTVLKKNAYIGVPSEARHLDPELWTDPLKFDGYRFVKMREATGAGSKYQFIDTGLEHGQLINFGYGVHACPGRFFANNEIKVILGYMVEHYDIKLPNGADRPSLIYEDSGIRTDPSARLMVRKRKLAN